MKNQLLLYILTIFSLTSFCQEKVPLTKQETVNYLNKKMNEANSHYRSDTYTSGEAFKKFYNGNLSFNLSGEKTIVSYRYSNYSVEPSGINTSGWGWVYPCDYFYSTYSQTFNPAHIKSFELITTPGDPVGLLQIILISKTAIEEYRRTSTQVSIETGTYIGQCRQMKTIDKTSSLQIIDFPFLQADPDNLTKIKKALLYLRDLCKAEDDPVGN